jgi:uncharacterized protein YjgD (DUF1641 family)
MAVPITFQPKKIDPREELQRRLEAAPMKHAESILVALDLLETAHTQGLLGLAEGAIASKEAVFAKLAEYGKQPESTNALRNLLTLGKLAGSLDPEMLELIAKGRAPGPTEPPSLLKLFLRAGRRDVRRGLGTMLDLLGLLGSR